LEFLSAKYTGNNIAQVDARDLLCVHSQKVTGKSLAKDLSTQLPIQLLFKNYLYSRCSKIFRNKWIEDLTEVFKLVLEGGKKDLCNGNCAPLPPPKCKAELLSQTATFMIKDWYKLYGDKPKYFRLKMGYRHVCAMYKSRVSESEQTV
jgi:hypothetical protein